MNAVYSRTRLIAAVAAGNVLEWYDFMLFASFAHIIATVFFPFTTPLLGLLATFATFALGFITRPIGAFIFGVIGDYTSRFAALLLSITLMTLPTVLLGCLPSYHQVGILAPILLTLLRVVQGISIAGELPGTIVILTENAKRCYRGLSSSFAIMGIIAGFILSAVVTNLIHQLFPLTVIRTWAWRIPFWAGALLAIIAFVLRKRAFSRRQISQSSLVSMPLTYTFKYLKTKIFQVMGIQCLATIAFNIILLFDFPLLIHFLKLSHKLTSLLVLASLITTLIFIPIFAILSDRIGRKPILLGACIAFILLGEPLYSMITEGSLILLIMGQIGLCIILAAYLSVVNAISVELFDNRFRYMPLAIAHNLVFAVVGGTALFVCTALIAKTELLISPIFYIIVTAILSGWVGLYLPETYRKRLET